MSFNSLHFLLFFPITVLLYWVVPKKARYIWLLIASYYFYMSWNAKYAILIALSTVITYGSGCILEYLTEKNSKVFFKKLTVAASFTVNLAILLFFKYFNFLNANISTLFSHVSSQSFSVPLDIILPVGISFYTLQALGYTVDVYRGDVKAEKNIFKYALFVSFFPQLVAGPIERSKNLLAQIDSLDRNRFSISNLYTGLIEVIWGLFLKMVIADRVAILVDTVFDQFYRFGTIELIVGAIAFALQLYCDFSSYSIIAVGVARTMGVTLMENFNAPYLSNSVKDFWRRWHISLSTWFRDYLYIPMGGNRCIKAKKYFNLMVTFLVSGLWHGASWHFVMWGGIHGLYQILELEISPVIKRINVGLNVKTSCLSYRLSKIIVTDLMVTFAWIFFRSNGLIHALKYIGRLFTHWDPWVLFNGTLYTLGLNQFEINVLLDAFVILFLMELVKYQSHQTVSDFLIRQNLWFQYVFLAGLLVAIVIYGHYGAAFDAKAFIYFQF